MKRQIIITNCKNCPYSDTFLSANRKKYCNKLTKYIYGKFKHLHHRVPSLPDNIAYIPKNGIRKDCPLKPIKDEK